MVSFGNSLLSNSFTLIHDCVSGNIVDPSSRSKKWIFTDFPDATSTKFPNYPIITISNAQIDSNNISFSNLRDYSINHVISVYTAGSAALLDSLVGSVITLMDSKDTIFLASGLALDDFSVAKTRTGLINKQKVRSVDITYNFRLSSV